MFTIHDKLEEEDKIVRDEFNLAPSTFTQAAMYMPVHGELKNFSFKNREYLLPIYNTNARKVLLQCGRQVEKTVPQDTEILKENGNLVPIKDIRIGDMLACLNTHESRPGIEKGLGDKLVTSKVSWKSELYTKPCVEITTRQGHRSKMATTHPVRVWGGWRTAAELAVGDRVAVVRRSGVFGNTHQSPERVELTAFIIGDGGCKKYINFTSGCDEVSNAFLGALEKLGCVARLRYPRPSLLRANLSKAKCGKVYDWLWEDDLLGTDSYTKFVPDWVFDLSKEQTSLFLNRLWSTDGHVKQNTRSKWSIEYCSMSGRLIKQVQSLLWKFGIPSKIRENWPSIYKRRGEKKTAYILRVETQEGIRRFIRDIGALGKIERQEIPEWEENNNRDTYPQEVTGLVREIYTEVSPKRGDRTLRSEGIERLPRRTYTLTPQKLERYVEFFEGDNRYDQDKVALLRAHLTSDIYWDTITSIEDLGELPCYDLTVEDHHNYISSGIITHNSTTLGNIALTYSMLRKHFRTLFVSPTQTQTEVFSRDKIETPILNSPKLRTLSSGRGTKDNVLLKKFITQSEITLRYAFLHADRVRGIFADMLLLDEIQDILTDVIPVIEEALSHSDYKIFRYSGTPKSLDNTISVYWENFSTQNEWVIPCDHCGGGDYRHWNIINDDNIGPKFLCCDKCGGQIYPTHPDAQWASMNPNPGIADPFEGYRIPQPITAWLDWQEILDKRTRYSKAQFNNEVLGLGYDSGDRPLTLTEVRANCREDLTMYPPLAPRSGDVYMGIDWGSGEQAYTVVTLGRYMGNRFTIFYWKRYEGSDADVERMLADIYTLYKKYNVTLIGTDYGGGYHTNDRITRMVGARNIVKYQYAGSKKKLYYDKDLNRFMVNRTAVLMDYINAIKRGDEFAFPRWEEMSAKFTDTDSSFAGDMVNIFKEYNEARKCDVLNKVPGTTDDALHSSLYCFLASMVKHPRPDILTPMGDDK